jgi:outer membrane immunogenic protein
LVVQDGSETLKRIQEFKEGTGMKNLLLAGIGISIGTLFWMPAMAADMGKAAPIYKAAPKVAAFTWSGCYLGVQGGYGWGSSNTDAGSLSNRIADETPADFSSKPRGGIVGGQLGCNYQLSGNWVVGVEGEGWRSWMKETATSLAAENDTTDLHTLRAQNTWDAALSLRLGYAVDRTLFYVKGGGAYGSFQYTFVDAADFHDFDVNSSKFGWMVGGGVEYAFTDNLTARVEYDYLDFGTNSVSTFLIASERVGLFAGAPTPYNFSVSETKSIAKAGLSLKF